MNGSVLTHPSIVTRRCARQDRQIVDSGDVSFAWQTPWVPQNVTFGQKFRGFRPILIVTTVRSPGRADPSFLAIKRLGILPAAGLGIAKTLNYYGFTKRLQDRPKMTFSRIYTKCHPRANFDKSQYG